VTCQSLRYTNDYHLGIVQANLSLHTIYSLIYWITTNTSYSN